jgi:Uma2 family endonuclease
MIQTLARPTIGAGSRIVLHDVDWATYTHFLKMFGESPTAKLTYDRGVLEIMSPSLQHDDGSRAFVYLIQILAEEWNLPLKAAGSTTMRRKQKQAGLEPDECFWLTNAPRMAGRRQLDLGRDPPPDLAIEIEVSRRSKLDRMSLYARLRVPEVWRYGKKGLAFFGLEGKKYQPVPTSVAFDGLTPAFVERFVDKAAEAGDVLGVLRGFRVAVRKVRAK